MGVCLREREREFEKERERKREREICYVKLYFSRVLLVVRKINCESLKRHAIPSALCSVHFIFYKHKA